MFKPHPVFFILIALTLWLPQRTTLAQSPPVLQSERERGIELYRAKDFVAASKVLKTAVKKNATDDQAWYYLGLALSQQSKELKEASKAFETAIKLRPNFAAAHTGLSYVLLRRNKYSDALQEAQTALKLNSGIANAHYVIAVVRLNEGAFEDALTEANEAIQLNANFGPAYLVKSEALWGLWAGLRPAPDHPCGRPGFTPSRSAPVPVNAPSAEELEASRLRRKQNEVHLRQSLESLETYLKLSPADPSANHWQQQLATLRIFNNVGKTDLEAVKHGADVTTKARVLSKPAPNYTDEARQNGVKGVVVLRGVFASDGTVRNLIVLRGLPSGLGWQTVEAARKIRFTPAMIDGKPVSMFIQLEYCFDLF